jgi:hypothetical protein
MDKIPGSIHSLFYLFSQHEGFPCPGAEPAAEKQSPHLVREE